MRYYLIFVNANSIGGIIVFNSVLDAKPFLLNVNILSNLMIPWLVCNVNIKRIPQLSLLYMHSIFCLKWPKDRFNKIMWSKSSYTKVSKTTEGKKSVGVKLFEPPWCAQMESSGALTKHFSFILSVLQERWQLRRNCATLTSWQTYCREETWREALELFMKPCSCL